MFYTPFAFHRCACPLGFRIALKSHDRLLEDFDELSARKDAGLSTQPHSRSSRSTQLTF